MIRSARLILFCVAALALAGCGNKEEERTLAETEGIYVTVDDLTYQVQLSRILNPASLEDKAYLRGVPAGETTLAEDEVWFAVFMRVENETDELLPAADQFTVVDTQETEFEPVELDTSTNAFAYEAHELPPGGLIPAPNTAASDNTIQGALVLFKVKTGSLYNRPLELRIARTGGETTAIVDLDV